MSPDLTFIVDKPWGLALLLFALLSPRLALRLRAPAGLQIIDPRRLLVGYIGAVLAGVAAALFAESAQIRPWIEFIPVRTASELIEASTAAKYMLAALLSWFAAAYLAAPVAAWLASQSLANGLLLMAACFPFAIVIGVGSWLAWLHPQRSLLFNLACSLVFVFTTTLGFAVGARMPLSFRIRSASAA